MKHFKILKKNTNTLIILIFFFSINIQSQEYNKKTRNFIGTFHTNNTTINGISVGAFPNYTDQVRFVKTNGIRIEAPGIGFLAFMAGNSLLLGSDNNIYEEIVNGINISSGTIGDVLYNGITIAAVVQNGKKNNGIAITGMWNAMNIMNGVQISGLLNEAEYSNGLQVSLSNTTLYMKGIQIGGVNHADNKMTGLQIGLYNRSGKTKGIQIGLWNVNEKRSLPIINWNFKK